MQYRQGSSLYHSFFPPRICFLLIACWIRSSFVNIVLFIQHTYYIYIFFYIDIALFLFISCTAQRELVFDLRTGVMKSTRRLGLRGHLDAIYSATRLLVRTSCPNPREIRSITPACFGAPTKRQRGKGSRSLTRIAAARTQPNALLVPCQRTT